MSHKDPAKEVERRRKYYLENKKRLNKKAAEHYLVNKEKISESGKKYREENREKLSERSKKYYYDNPEKIAKYRADNKEKIAKYLREYNENNKVNQAKYNAAYKADLKDGYIRGLIIKTSTLEATDITQELIELVRLRIQIKRGIRDGKKDNENN